MLRILESNQELKKDCSWRKISPSQEKENSENADRQEDDSKVKDLGPSFSKRHQPFKVEVKIDIPTLIE